MSAERISFLESSISTVEGQIKKYEEKIKEGDAREMARLHGAVNDAWLTLKSHKLELGDLKTLKSKI